MEGQDTGITGLQSVKNKPSTGMAFVGPDSYSVREALPMKLGSGPLMGQIEHGDAARGKLSTGASQEHP